MQVIARWNGTEWRVVNLVSDPPPQPDQEVVWDVPNNSTVQVGDVFDPRDKEVDDMDRVILRITYRHENLIRQLIRALRNTSTAANNAATSAGLPTLANSQDLTEQQFKGAVKALL